MFKKFAIISITTLAAIPAAKGSWGDFGIGMATGMITGGIASSIAQRPRYCIARPVVRPVYYVQRPAYVVPTTYVIQKPCVTNNLQQKELELKRRKLDLELIKAENERLTLQNKNKQLRSQLNKKKK